MHSTVVDKQTISSIYQPIIATTHKGIQGHVM